MATIDLRIDIVSDIICPWCAIGYHRLRRVLADLQMNADLHWHPFQLNPQIPQGGKNLQAHLREKYADPEASNAAARQHITDLGAELGFRFNYRDDMRTYNSAQVHQLMLWAETQGRQTALAEELFRCYFTEQQALDSPDVLLAAAASVGLDSAQAQQALDNTELQQKIQLAKTFWLSMGISGVPAFVFGRQYLLNGAQESSVFKEVIQRTMVSRSVSAG